MNATTSAIIALGLLLCGLFIYFMPTLIAERRKHPSAGAIFALNLFLGWTFLGWVLALVWANTNPGRSIPSRPGAKDVPVASADELAEFNEFRRWQQLRQQQGAIPARRDPPDLSLR